MLLITHSFIALQVCKQRTGLTTYTSNPLRLATYKNVKVIQQLLTALFFLIPIDETKKY